MIVLDRVEVVHDLEPRAVLASWELRIVDRGEIGQHVEGEDRFVATVAQHVGEGVVGDDNGLVPAMRVGLDDGAGGEAVPELVDQARSFH